MSNRNEIKSLSTLDFEDGLGLKMQLKSTEPFNKRAMPVPLYQYQVDSSERNDNTDSFSGDRGGGGYTFFNKMVGGSDIYGGGGADTAVFRASESVMPVSCKSLFTASQWQELERQQLIHKYMMASMPVPPQLLLPISRIPSIAAAASQSNTSGLDSRFSSIRSDPEPWRCKRTDGKKWRCSRDVAPDQKYCERHSHKSRPRSRKHVEIASHNNNINNTSSASTTTTPQSLQKPISQFPTMASATSYDQTRCIEWFMRGGSSSNTSPVSTCNQQPWQQVMPTSSRFELNRDNNNNRDYNKLQGFMGLENHNQLINNGQSCNSILDSKMTSLLQGNPTTRHFIDGISSTKFSPSALSLSMSGYYGINNHHQENVDLGIGMIHSDRDSDGILKSQWLNPVSWMNSPLGEALCLGNAGTTVGHTDLSSPHTNSSKSSCEDGSHAFNFIG